jgi:hypothetical protein
LLARNQQTLTIEAMLKKGQSISSIARQVGVSRQRVQNINRRLLRDYEVATATPVESPSGSPMKSLSINLTPAVHDALVEACAVANRRAPEESITLQEYVEECVITRVVELGLLRRKKRT